MNLLTLRKLPCIAISVFIFYSCTYDIKEVLKPKPNPIDTTNKDDTTIIVKFADVESIFKDNDCFSCHSGGSGGVAFEDYISLKNYLKVDSVIFIKSIKHESSSTSKYMPQGKNKLTEDKIQKILTWIRQGIN